ncbi:hypothetical protein E2C01_069016 [Portunus trituberculatus]|uniref:Uncharacterized protein n=1 Tax=Portunus trituberculatus TaxID=210409 RepID=A0A5B7HZH5_PORTR|nr:hypothetical protein [Portunus trituberculatus]
MRLYYRCRLGNNGTFQMYLEGDGGMFGVTPPEGVNFASFLIRVRNPSLLDYEKVKGELNPEVHLTNATFNHCLHSFISLYLFFLSLTI